VYRALSLVCMVVLLALLWVLRDPSPHQAGLDDAPGPVATHQAGVLVVDFLDGTSEQDIQGLAARTGIPLAYSSSVSEDEALTYATVDDLADALALLVGEPSIEAIEPAVTMVALGYPDDPRYDEQWNLRMIGTPTGWRVGAGRGVTVAVIDTGVTQGPDLEGVRVREGMSFVPGVDTAQDDQGHGTHVAGTIAQATHNGLGVAGLAPKVTLLPYKVLDANGSGRSDHIAAAVDQAVDDGADVINLSLGGGHSDVLHLAVERAAEAGVIVVAAAGNTGREGVGCPAHAVNVLGVGSVGPNSTPAPYTTWGEGVDLMGPGGDTTLPGGGVLQETIAAGGGAEVKAFQGTSMASPHVAGAAAVLLGAGVGTPARVRDLLLSTAGDLGEPGFDTRTGYGLLDLGAAVRHLQLRVFAPLFGVGGLLALLMAGLAKRSKGAVLVAASTGALVAGGLFFLPLLPLEPSLMGSLLSRGLLHWPGALLGHDWTHFPLWASAALPILAAVLLGTGRFWPLAVGLGAGVGVALMHGAVSGQLDPWWFSDSWATGWLVVNGVIALLIAVAVAGLQRAEATGRMEA